MEMKCRALQNRVFYKIEIELFMRIKRLDGIPVQWYEEEEQPDPMQHWFLPNLLGQQMFYLIWSHWSFQKVHHSRYERCHCRRLCLAIVLDAAQISKSATTISVKLVTWCKLKILAGLLTVRYVYVDTVFCEWLVVCTDFCIPSQPHTKVWNKVKLNRR